MLSVTVNIARIPLTPASMAVATAPFSVDEPTCALACLLGSIMDFIGKAVAVMVTTIGCAVTVGQCSSVAVTVGQCCRASVAVKCCLQDTPAAPMCLTSLRPSSKVNLLVAQLVICDSLPVHFTLLNRTARLDLQKGESE